VANAEAAKKYSAVALRLEGKAMADECSSERGLWFPKMGVPQIIQNYVSILVGISTTKVVDLGPM